MIKEVLETMVGLAEEGMTMLCATHEMGFARQVANRVIFMDQGQIVEQNSPAEFFDNPQHERTKLFLSQILHQANGEDHAFARGQADRDEVCDHCMLHTDKL